MLSPKMPQTAPIEIEAIDKFGVGVRARFTWQADRYGHTIYFVRGEKETACLQSCEGAEKGTGSFSREESEPTAATPSENVPVPFSAWPLSPPVQQIHEQVTDGRRILFLTGMAGGTHWSMTVEAVAKKWPPESEPSWVFPPRDDLNKPEPQGLTNSISFDIAARVKSPPLQLGSCYQLVAPNKWIDYPTFKCAVGPHSGIAIGQLDDKAEQCQWREPDQHRRTITPHISDNLKPPATIQWSCEVFAAIM